MNLIDFEGKKAYLLTTLDLAAMDRSVKLSRLNRLMLESARKDGITFLIVITSLRKKALPFWLKDRLDSVKKCYFGLI